MPSWWWFSKQMHAVPTTTTLTAEGTATLLRDQVFRLHGVPAKIIHDRGPQFQSRFVVNFYRLLGIENNPSTAYHPQSDGQTERVNQELEQYLWLYINHHQDDWVDWLSIAEFAHNNRVSATDFSERRKCSSRRLKREEGERREIEWRVWWVRLD